MSRYVYGVFRIDYYVRYLCYKLLEYGGIFVFQIHNMEKVIYRKMRQILNIYPTIFKQIVQVLLNF